MWGQAVGTSFALIALAEVGDKSQLVCMTLAARHGRVGPVLAGAVAAFALLNGLAALFGAALAAWLPREWVLVAMAVLFGFFGIHALMQRDDGEADGATRRLGRHGLLLTTFFMIFLAELGDKTQIAVAGLAGIDPPDAVWLGATLALTLTSLVGAVAGKTVLSRLPVVWIHRLAGVLFLAMAGLALWRLFGDGLP